LDAFDRTKMEELYLYRQRLLNRMESVVEDLRRAASSASPEEWHVPKSDDQPSPHRLLAHLRSIEIQALAPRLKTILTEDHPNLVLFDDDRWMETHYRKDEPVDSIIDDYERIRQEELSWLTQMDPRAWSRTCRHPWFGVRTLQWWVEKTMAYAEEHLQDIISELSNRRNN
jgi:hypothetical protein